MPGIWIGIFDLLTVIAHEGRSPTFLIHSRKRIRLSVDRDQQLLDSSQGWESCPIAARHTFVRGVMNGAQRSDNELVALAKAGEFSAFDELVTRHSGRVYAFVLRMLGHVEDAEDVTQQTFLSALVGISGFRAEAAFSTWLLRIASHAALKVIRKRKGLPTIPLDTASDDSDYRGIVHPKYIADWRESPEDLVNRREVAAILQESLATLDEKHRFVFLLRDVEGLSIAETAESLGLTEANVKVRLLRARLQLREILTRELGDPKTELTAVGH